MTINGTASEYEFPKYQSKFMLDETEYDKAYQQGRSDRDKELLKEVDYLLNCSMGKKKALVHLRGILVKGQKNE